MIFTQYAEPVNFHSTPSGTYGPLKGGLRGRRRRLLWTGGLLSPRANGYHCVDYTDHFALSKSTNQRVQICKWKKGYARKHQRKSIKYTIEKRPNSCEQRFILLTVHFRKGCWEKKELLKILFIYFLRHWFLDLRELWLADLLRDYGNLFLILSLIF